MKGQFFRRFLICIAGVFFLFAIIPLSSSAEVPKKINYQGYLTDSSGAVDGTVTMTFSIYDTDDPLVTTPLWTETHSSVAVNQGVYSVVLGSVDESGNPLDLAFDVQYYLGVTVGTDAEMTPRQPLTAAPYALNAGSAGYAYDVQDGTVTSSKLSAGAVTAGKIAAGAVGTTEIIDGTVTGADIAPGVVPDGHSLDAADGSPVDAVYVDNDGKVGIGTTGPSAELHVKGDSRLEGNTGTQPYTYYTYTKGADQDISCGSTPSECNCDTGSSSKDCGSGFNTFSNEGSYCYDYYWVPFDCRRIQYDLTATTSATATHPRFIHTDDNANIGIGTINPQGKLHIEDVMYDRGVMLGCPSGYTAGDFDGEGDEADCKALGIVAKENGNVGIGTASPSSKLHVVGTVTADNMNVAGTVTANALNAAGSVTANAFVGDGSGLSDTGPWDSGAADDIWTPVETARTWKSVAMSADGTRQTAVVYGGQIYVSSNSGSTWTAKGTSADWQSVAMSADGSRQTAVVNLGSIYVSTDSGNTWTPVSGTDGVRWVSVAMSSDGSIQTAVVVSGDIYVSTDSGSTWTPKGVSADWRSVAMSSDGSVQTAVGLGSMIYVSTDSGVSWTPKYISGQWRSVAMSSDGSIQAVLYDIGSIHMSTDYGDTWAGVAGTWGPAWYSVAMSSDGSVQTAVVNGGKIYVSTDNGSTWTPEGPGGAWQSVAMSADGSIQTAVASGGRIHRLENRASLSYTGLTVNLDGLEVSGGIINDFAIFQDRKPVNTPGGDFQADTWYTRTLNAIASSYGSSIKLCASAAVPEPECTGGNQIWLAAGTYLIDGRAPAFGVGRHKAFFINRTDDIWEIVGSSAYSNRSYYGHSDSIIKGVVTIAEPKVFEVVHQCETTYLSQGMGVESNIGTTGPSAEVYTEVYIRKLK